MTTQTLTGSDEQIDSDSPFFVELAPRRQIHLQVHDSPSTTTVFFCHGAGGNKQQWRQQWQHLRKNGVRLVAWDALGHGSSARPKAVEAFAGKAFVEDYQTLLERYGSARNILIGHSYGARLTLALLQRLQAAGQLDRVERAVLLGPQGPTATFDSQLLRQPVWLLTLLRKRLEKGFRQLAWHPDADPALVDYEEQVARGNSLRVFKALASQPAVLDVDRLAQLHLPVLLLAGDSDGLTPASGARDLAERLPDASLHVFERCGHQIMLERPAQTLAHIVNFIHKPAADLATARDATAEK